MDIGTALLSALLAIIVGFVAGHKVSSSRSEEIKETLSNRISVLVGEVNKIKSMLNAHEREMILRVVVIEKDVDGMKESSVNYVTAIELERRLEPMIIKKDELRRRIIRIERSLFKDDLDGADSSQNVTVVRPQSGG